jgi:hypothetical protein
MFPSKEVFFKLSFEVEPVVVTQLDGNGLAHNGDNNGGGGNDGANEDDMDTANDVDIERAKNIELQGNGNSLKSNGKKTNNTTGVVGHQLQHHVDDPISVGSLNMGMLSNGIHANILLSEHIVQQDSSTYLNSTENYNFIDTHLLFHDSAVKDREIASFNVDPALGSEKTRLPEVSGLEG